LEQAPEEITEVVVREPVPFEASVDEEQEKVESPEEFPPIESSVAGTSAPTEVKFAEDSESCATQDILPTT